MTYIPLLNSEYFTKAIADSSSSCSHILKSAVSFSKVAVIYCISNGEVT